MDWQQVVLNGGPPCFHIAEDGRFCGRAKRWDGHDSIHAFVSLGMLIENAFAAGERKGRIEGLKDALEMSVRGSHVFYTISCAIKNLEREQQSK